MKEDIWVDVDQSAQTLTVMSGEQVVRRMTISSGKDGTPTPSGVFHVQNRGEWFFNSRYGQGARYWVSFLGWGAYLIHSVTCDANQQVIAEEADLLGSKASHGCIRMAMEDARWFYETIPEGALLEIHD
ncbi:MAG: L,D-transpeptidase [Clostridia bacterium]|nr:L,D-transpeptidase [Clostridia bacterium]